MEIKIGITIRIKSRNKTCEIARGNNGEVYALLILFLILLLISILICFVQSIIRIGFN
jgi:hypothetical protein